MHLIVVEPFGPYRKGDLITEGVEAVLREHAGSVVKVASPEQPKAEEVPEVPASPPQPEKPAEEPKDAQ
jgi:hypothetical protein